jgi:hypothetical protein
VLRRVLACVRGLTFDQRVPYLAQRYRRSPVPNGMVKFDVGAVWPIEGRSL